MVWTRRARWWAVLVVLFSLAFTVAWIAWGSVEVGRAALVAQATTQRLAGDPSLLTASDLQSSAEQLEADAARFRRATESAQWRLVEQLPGVGPTAQRVARLSVGLDNATTSVLRIARNSPEPDALLSAETSLPTDSRAREGARAALYDLGSALDELARDAVVRPLARSLRGAAAGARSLGNAISPS